MSDVTDVSQLLLAAIGNDEQNENTDDSSDGEDDDMDQINTISQPTPREIYRMISSDEYDDSSEDEEDFSTTLKKKP